MNLDDVLADLLGSPLNEFTNRRNLKAKELKAAGERELAEEVNALKKPPVPVWAVNQLARGNKAALERLKQMGEGVVQAQQAAVSGRRNAAQELRSASDKLQRELEVAVRTVADRLRTDGHAADEATLRRVQEILRLGAVSGGDTWDRLRTGTLIEEPKAGEDMLTAAFALGAGKPAAQGKGDRPVKSPDADGVTAKQAAETEKRLELEHAQRTAKLDEDAADQAEQTARRLREEADRMAVDAKRANEKARQAAKEFDRLREKASSSAQVARKLSRSVRAG